MYRQTNDNIKCSTEPPQCMKYFMTLGYLYYYLLQPILCDSGLAQDIY